MEGYEENEQIVLTGEDGKEITLNVIDTTRIAGVEYLLASEEPEAAEGAEAFIFRMTEDGDDYILEPVEDPSEIEYIGKVFTEQNEDIDIIG